MSTTFPRTKKSRNGYSVEQVEDFLEDARRAYSAQPGEPVALDSDGIRKTAFSMQKGGYSPRHVDAALERLEDAFAERERERARRELGDEEWFTDARRTAKEILDRLGRPAGHRFDRVGILSEGYDHRQVDAFATRLVSYFQNGQALTVQDVRTAAFRPRRGGYREAQVDLLLDTVVRVMLAVK